MRCLHEEKLNMDCNCMDSKNFKIEKLESENARLRKALESIVKHMEISAPDTVRLNLSAVYKIAKEALEGGKS